MELGPSGFGPLYGKIYLDPNTIPCAIDEVPIRSFLPTTYYDILLLGGGGLLL